MLRHVDTASLEAMTERPAADLVGIVVIDSGIATAHPLLRPLIGDAQVMPRVGAADTAGDVDAQTGGHGTAVAGIAAFGDLGECLEMGRFIPGGLLFSARVTTPENEYDPDYLVEHQLVEAVEYFIQKYPAVHVFNISLGDLNKVYRENEYQFRFAATIDELAYRHRDREIVFVVSTGNLRFDQDQGEALLSTYPTHLLDDASRLIDPATAAIALTVGGLSYGEGMRFDGAEAETTDRLVARERFWPSPFTRSGPGVNGCIKPELVDFAGDVRFVRGRLGRESQHAGVPTTSKDFAPPSGTLLRTVSGTSYAAPRVANLAARLFQSFPNASSNLIRALIASSAEIPESRPPAFRELDPSDSSALRVYGYGQPNFERARWSAENDVLLIADEIIDLDSFALFEVASLPANFLTAKGSGELGVTLAFDPPTRHTRMDSYLGVNMEAHLFRNSSPDEVAETMRAYAHEEREGLAEEQKVELRKVKLPRRSNLSSVDLRPTVTIRKKGTLQRAVDTISSARWAYDGRPLILGVVCRRLWAPDAIKTQRFAAIVTLRHQNERVLLHQHIRTQATVSVRARVTG